MKNTAKAENDIINNITDNSKKLLNEALKQAQTVTINLTQEKKNALAIVFKNIAKETIKITDTTIDALGDILKTTTKGLMNAGLSFLKEEQRENIINAVEKIIDLAIEIPKKIISGIVNTLEKGLNFAVEKISTLMKNTFEKISSWIEGKKTKEQVFNEIKNDVSDLTNDLVTKVKTEGKNLVGNIEKNVTDVGQKVKDEAVKFAQEGKEIAKDVIGEKINEVKQKFTDRFASKAKEGKTHIERVEESKNNPDKGMER